jgi:hypothetical protein
MNNPLAGTDPTGYAADCIIQEFCSPLQNLKDVMNPQNKNSPFSKFGVDAKSNNGKVDQKPQAKSSAASDAMAAGKYLAKSMLVPNGDALAMRGEPGDALDFTAGYFAAGINKTIGIANTAITGFFITHGNSAAIINSPLSIPEINIPNKGLVGAFTNDIVASTASVLTPLKSFGGARAAGASEVAGELAVVRAPTKAPPTSSQVGRFIGDSKGNTMIEPVGGKTVPAGKGGVDTHTLYPNGSNYQRLNPQGHTNNPTPHGHGHLPGTGPGMKGQGPSTDPHGNVVPWNSPAAHWPIH